MESYADRVKCLTTSCSGESVYTRELPKEGSIRFLNLSLNFADPHFCWTYEPCSEKGVVPHHSAHSKLIKRGRGRDASGLGVKEVLPTQNGQTFSEPGAPHGGRGLSSHLDAFSNKQAAEATQHYRKRSQGRDAIAEALCCALHSQVFPKFEKK